MKKLTSQVSTYKLISSHALLAAVITNAYLLSLLTDLIRIVNRDSTEVVVNPSFMNTLSILSFTALIIAVIAFLLHMVNKQKIR